MTPDLRRSVAIGLATIAIGCGLPGSLGAAANQAATDEAELPRVQVELRRLDLEIDVLYRRTPVCDPALDLETLDILARKAGEMDAVEIRPAAGRERERVVLDGGRTSSIEILRYELSGRQPYERVGLLLTRIGLRARLVELESLRVTAAPAETVNFSMRFALPCYAPAAPELPAPRHHRVEDYFAEALASRRATLAMLNEQAARSHPERLAEALAAFGREIGTRAVALDQARFDGDLVLTGLLAGPAARAALEPAARAAGFLPTSLDTVPAGPCQRFTVAAVVEPRESPEERDYAVGNGLFDEKAAALCAPAPAPVRVEARGTSTAAGAADSLDLRLRDVDVGHVFYVLHNLTGQGFVVDADAQGRVTLEVEGATLAETLTALGAAGVAVGPGAVRRVSRAGTAAPPAAGRRARYQGEDLSVTLQNSDLAITLCVLSRVVQREIWAPRDLRGSVTLFAHELASDQVLEGLLASIGLTSKLEGERLVVAPAHPMAAALAADMMNACEIPSQVSPSRRLAGPASVPEMTVADLDLVGLARAGDQWVAYTVTPTRLLHKIEAGYELLDAKVDSVGPAGVRLSLGAGGVVDLPLRR